MKTTILARFAVLCALILPAAPQAFGFGAGGNTFPGTTADSLSPHYSGATDITAFTSEAGEPSYGAGHTAWWTFTAPEAGYCTVDTLRGDAAANAVQDTKIGVYTGDAVNALVTVAQNDDYGNGNLDADYYLSRTTFYAQKDGVYHIAVDAFNLASITGTTFNVVLSVRLMPLRKTMRNAAFISSASGNASGLGMVNVITTGTGSFSGKLTLGATVYPLKGVFGVDGLATLSFERKAPAGAFPLPPITLVVDGTVGGNYLVTIPGLGSAGGELLEQTVFSLGSPTTVAGYYTAYTVFVGSNAYGTLTQTVSPTGAITGAGTAFDGTAFTFSSALHNTSSATTFYVPVFKSLSSGLGAIETTLAVIESGATDRLTTVGAWYIRPVPKAGVLFYPGGFNQSFLVAGGTYTKPATNTRALGFLDATTGVGKLVLTDEGADLGGDINEPLTLSTANKFTFGSLVRKPVLTLTAATGLVTGSITAPPMKARTIKGILSTYQGTVSLHGYVTGGAKNLRMDVTP